LDEEIIKRIVKKTLDEESRKNKKSSNELRNWKLHNTKLLLENYHILKSHVHDINSTVDNYLSSIFDPDDLKLKSVIKYKLKTREMMDYINAQLVAYQIYCDKSGDVAKRRYKVLKMYYIDPFSKHKPTVIDIAENQHSSEKTVKRDLEKAREEFSTFLFGISGIESLTSK